MRYSFYKIGRRNCPKPRNGFYMLTVFTNSLYLEIFLNYAHILFLKGFGIKTVIIGVIVNKI